MGVLVEANSVIVKRESIGKKYPGGWPQFVTDAPNQTLCFDEHLARVGFMNDKDAEGYIRELEQRGLTYLQNDRAVDIVMAFQLGGLSARCEWADFGHGYLDPEDTQKISVCCASHEEIESVEVPEGWQFDGSLSDAYSFTPAGESPENLTFLRHENGVDVFYDNESGKEVYQGRVKSHPN